MDLYEYQGKELFKRFGIPVSEGRLATSPEEARAAPKRWEGRSSTRRKCSQEGAGKLGGSSSPTRPRAPNRAPATSSASTFALCFTAGITDSNEQRQVVALIGKLYEAFVGCDAMLCEVNPLIVTPEDEVRALDSKFTVDDNALERHPAIADMRDLDAYPPEERVARAKGVTYVKLDGEVGILGNGAGLVMSTLDVIAHVGGRPANFCDLGGGGDAQGVVDALEVITGDDQVESILFNIFGGTRCDEAARGILEALGRMAIEDPIVVRLEGTNAEEGRRLLTEAAPSNLYVEETMLSAAERAVEVAR